MSKLAYDPRHALNAICPYFTMFPLEYPLGILKERAREIVLDPFCGRGTSLYAAVMCGFETYGIDSSPVAVAIARAKLARTSAREVLSLAKRLLADTKWPSIPRGTFWRYAYHPDTLREICRLRSGLLGTTESPASAFLRAIVLGALHGPRAKSIEEQNYFSNQMPRTYSSKPDYSVRYWRRHKLRPVAIDVLKVIERRAQHVLKSKMRARSAIDHIARGNSEDFRSYSHVVRPVTLVITSPPYYGLNTYLADQWLRNWFLGGPTHIEYDRGDQVSHRSPDQFAFSLARVWDNISTIGAENLQMVVRFGAIQSRNVNPIELFMSSLRKSVASWRVVTRVKKCGAADKGRRQATQMAVKSSPIEENDFYIVRG